ncbi:hypothetical protein ITP53_00275 [Nonomuraea sp. K274]|uniref:Uncharacterized protein n=1 Tax=Nonomuraea cypriaca TaxID=1187855 RepID=A0A931EYL9_9ACTN|nr:hypothetical protein [Nonomuraea cypriaca]MBF8184208.1 hypothetical protein [Nonomuraea cypriaca]
MSWLKRLLSKDRKPFRQPGSESPADETVSKGELRDLVERFPLRSGSYVTLLPPLTGELVRAQRAGTFFATDILRGYADRLHTAIRTAIGSDEPPVPRHSLLVRAGSLAWADDPAQPAVPLQEEGFSGTRGTLIRLDERGIVPYLHLTAAARTLSGARSAAETGAQAELPDLLDQAWFLLAFWLSNSLGDGRMLDAERRLIVHLVECCSRLHVLGEEAEPPPFVLDAIDTDLVVRHFGEEWVTTAHVQMPDGEISQEGHMSTYDTGRPLHVGALLRAQLHRDTSPGDPAAEFALGRLKAEADDLTGARTALEAARSHPDWSHRAESSLKDLRPEEASMELLTIFTNWGIETRANRPPDPGSPARAQVVEIGERLHLAGGTTLMRQTHEAFRRRTDREETNWLAMIWNGIGDWQN